MDRKNRSWIWIPMRMTVVTETGFTTHNSAFNIDRQI